MLHFRTLEVADLPFLKTLPSPRAFKLGLIKVLAGNENNSELPALLLVRSPQCWNLETLLLQFNQAPTFINQFLQLLMPLSPLILELTDPFDMSCQVRALFRPRQRVWNQLDGRRRFSSLYRSQEISIKW